MSNMITFEMDKSFAEDIASLGVEFVPNEHDEHLVDVTVNKWSFCDTLFAWFDDNCESWYWYNEPTVRCF